MVLARSIVEAVGRVFPQGEVDMAAVAGVLRPWLGGQRGNQPASGRHGADRLADQKLLVGRLQGGGVGGRDLLLAVPELRVVLLERDALRLERRGQLVDVVL